MSDFFHELTQYSKQIEKEIQIARSFLENAPEGYLSCENENGRIRYFRKSHGPHKDRKIECLSQKDPDQIRKLAQKRYDEDLLPVLQREEKALIRLQKELEKTRKEKCYSESNEYRKPWITPAFAMPEDHIEKWLNQPVTYKEMDPAVRTITTRKGEKVRSKSEKIIADELFYYDIPYRYEAALSVGNTTIHPDFTILNSRTGKVFYLEHLGMMDNCDYYNSVLHRLDLYSQNDIFIGDRLLLTYETNHYAINTCMLNHLIENYLI